MKGGELMIGNLKLARVQRGFTQYDVASKTGIDQSYLSKLENKQVVMTGELLKKLAEFYGVPQKELI